MSKQYFHFTLGPVQGFVAQARRTRDFWAGSFILSWLAAVAMKATQAQYPDKSLVEVIKFPTPNQDFMDWLEGKKIGESPKQGSIPNRFKAEVDENFKPELVTAAVQKAWKALADKVWEKDLAGVASKEAKAIWDRQIPAFWDMSWVIVDKESDSSALDRRKNWRTYAASNEGGVKCTMMEGWQELSGALSPNRKSLDAFWNNVIENGKAGIKSDLAKNETLCSIAFVKRRFSRYFQLVEINFSEQQGYLKKWSVYGWKLSSNVPSVTYMAAVHWLHDLIKIADSAELTAYQDAAFSISEQDEYSTILPLLSKNEEIGLGQKAIEFNKLLSSDGNVFFTTMLENESLFKDMNTKPTQLALKAVINNVKVKRPRFQAATPFYAILMMDGDSLGKQMSDPKKQTPITEGLEKFTGNVKEIVEKHNGFLIYAGGDDVLAILPLEDAIPCATALRKHYLSCFEGKGVDTTISGAIEFAHIKMPLTKVLKDAHQLLDDIAKDEAGRDALAIRVWKGGGLQLEWAQPWDIVLKCLDADLSLNSKLEHPQATITLLAEHFQLNQEKDEYFSSKFFYKLRERFSLLNPPRDKQNKITDFSVFKTEQDAIDLIAMEYLNSWGNKQNKSISEAKSTVSDLLNQCRPRKRKPETKPEEWLQISERDIEKKFAQDSKLTPLKKLDEFKIWEADAALLVRFLAQKGVETR